MPTQILLHIQVEAQNKDFAAVLQTDLSKRLVPQSVQQANL